MQFCTKITWEISLNDYLVYDLYALRDDSGSGCEGDKPRVGDVSKIWVLVKSEDCNINIPNGDCCKGKLH